MNFTLTVPTYWNYTPSDLMRNYCANNRHASFERDRYFTAYVYTNGKSYYYDHLNRKDNGDQTETVTVFLEERRNANDLPDFTSPEAFFCEPD
jgi:hypothetical protein